VPGPTVEVVQEAADGGVVLADAVVVTPEDPAEIGAKMKDPLEALGSGRIQSDDELSLGQETVRSMSNEDDHLSRHLFAEVRHGQQSAAGFKDDSESRLGLVLEEALELLGNLRVRDNHEGHVRWPWFTIALPCDVSDGLESLLEGLISVPHEGHGCVDAMHTESRVLAAVPRSLHVVLGLEGLEVQVAEQLLPEGWRGQGEVE